MRARVRLGPLELDCEVAQTAAEQSRGLQGHAPLAPNQGMLFPFHPARSATFHMGSVQFPIDLVFADAAGRVARVVHAAQPGTRAVWSEPVVGAVVETAGGVCRAAGIGVGARVATSYNPLRTITEADAPAGDGGYYAREPNYPGGVDVPYDPQDGRFEDRRLPDEAFSEAKDQPMAGWEQQMGYWNVNEDVPAVRHAQQIDDPGLLIAMLVKAMADGAPLQWRPEPLNEAIEASIVEPAVLHRLLGQLNMAPLDRQQVLDALVTTSGLDTLADGLVLAGLADQARIQGDAVVLFRGRRP